MSNGIAKTSLFWVLFFWLVSLPAPCFSEELTMPFEQTVFQWAKECRDEVIEEFNLLIQSGQLHEGQVFDTFYVPIPNTTPQRFHTQYDTIADEVIRPILDRYLEKDPRIVFVVIVNTDGYLPTHNTRFSQPLTGDPEIDLAKNRAKLMTSNHLGIRASHNTEPFLLQKYTRDTGQEVLDMSVPIMVRKRHWGAVRIGFINK